MEAELLGINKLTRFLPILQAAHAPPLVVGTDIGLLKFSINHRSE